MIFNAGNHMRIACALQGIPNVCGASQLITQMISQEKYAGANGRNNQQYVHAYNLLRLNQSFYQFVSVTLTMSLILYMPVIMCKSMSMITVYLV